MPESVPAATTAATTVPNAASSALDWFAATLDSGQFEARATLRPPPSDLAAAVLPPDLGPARAQRPTPMVDHQATTVPPSALTPITADTMERELPRLTWVQGDEATDADPAASTDLAHADFVQLGLLGEGGMGRVLLVRQRSLHREVALKTVKELADRPAVRTALWREALVMGRLDHPNVVPVHLLGVDRQGRPALIMKRIDGISWHDLLQDKDHPLWARLGSDRLLAHVEILMRVADALEFAHARGVLHRDIKPENVLLGSFGEVYLGDWGVALELGGDTHEPLAIVGTPAFMAPEMLTMRRSDQGPWTDVFLLGATLHAALTGNGRHRGHTLRDMLDAVARVQSQDYASDIPPALAAIANRATAALPSDRYPNAAEFRLALRTFVQNRALDDIVNAAEQRLSELDQALTQGAPTDDRDGWLRRVHQLSSEARFGFLQVSKADPSHAAAALGLDNCLQRMIAFAIVCGNTAYARALYRELGRSVPQFEADLRSLTAADAAIVAERVAYAEHKRNFDPNANTRARLLVAAPMLVFAVSITIWILWDSPVLSVADLVRFGWALVVTVVVAALFAWRRATTTINREMIVLAVFVSGLILVQRLLLQASGHEDLPGLMRNDLLLLAASVVPMTRWSKLAWISGVVAVGTAVAITFYPQRATMLFSVAVMLFMAAVVVPPLVLRTRFLRD